MWLKIYEETSEQNGEKVTKAYHLHLYSIVLVVFFIALLSFFFIVGPEIKKERDAAKKEAASKAACAAYLKREEAESKQRTADFLAKAKANPASKYFYLNKNQLAEVLIPEEDGSSVRGYFDQNMRLDAEEHRWKPNGYFMQGYGHTLRRYTAEDLTEGPAPAENSEAPAFSDVLWYDPAAPDKLLPKGAIPVEAFTYGYVVQKNQDGRWYGWAKTEKE